MITTPSRRTVLRTTAWSVPAVAVTAAAPAHAASTTAELGILVYPECSTTFAPTNPAMTILNFGAAAVPATTMLTSFNTAENFVVVSPSGKLAQLRGTQPMGFELLSGQSASVVFYSDASFPTPGLLVTLAPGYTAARGSRLVGTTTSNACAR